MLKFSTPTTEIQPPRDFINSKKTTFGEPKKPNPSPVLYVRPLEQERKIEPQKQDIYSGEEKIQFNTPCSKKLIQKGSRSCVAATPELNSFDIAQTPPAVQRTTEVYQSTQCQNVSAVSVAIVERQAYGIHEINTRAPFAHIGSLTSARIATYVVSAFLSYFFCKSIFQFQK